MSVVAAFTRLAYQRRFTTEAAGLRTLARPKGPSRPPPAILQGYAVSTTRDHGFDLHRVRPHGPDTGVTVIYLHGGAYTSEIVRQHWSLVAFIAARTGHEVAVPIYGLAPHHHGLEALDFVTAVIAAETARGRRCYLAGDSAGGGLALLAAQATHRPVGAATAPIGAPTDPADPSATPGSASSLVSGSASGFVSSSASGSAPARVSGSAPGSAGSAPGSAGSAPGSAGSAPGSAGSAPGSAHDGSGGVVGVTAMAPWLDLSISNPEVDAVEPHDPWLRRPGLRPLAAAWAGEVPLQDPRLSPLFGDLTRLPPLQILVGTRDITLPDCRLLRDRLPPSVPLTYHEEPGAVHVYPLLPVPEARPGRQAIIDHIAATTTRPPT
ncbi:alpha/beta hydrolase family protein [Actinoplanes xinjiangensis]|uniref:Alpha/beta hydrolase family protein n=4 Tax=Actinoplanes xinjiangensis TaxID=512350 RepID=A0A316F777_9ACTN|nr:alpha/beta hydrolase family protein [Actinoplanes xinjiangensis]